MGSVHPHTPTAAPAQAAAAPPAGVGGEEGRAEGRGAGAGAYAERRCDVVVGVGVPNGAALRERAPPEVLRNLWRRESGVMTAAS